MRFEKAFYGSELLPSAFLMALFRTAMYGQCTGVHVYRCTGDAFIENCYSVHKVLKTTLFTLGNYHHYEEWLIIDSSIISH